MKRVQSFLAFALSLAFFTGMEACSSSSRETGEEKPIPVATPQPSPAAAAVPAPKLPPPSESEVQAAFHRVFGDELIVSISDRPFFTVGDFNGDQSEDLALIARPAAGKLADVNNELANWIIQDADRAFIAPAGKSVVVSPRQELPKVQTGEKILAIIHGVGSKGWRNPEARQAYIIKHAAAKLEGTAPSISQKAIRVMHLPVETEIIRERRDHGKGFVFWTGGGYAWHPSEG